MQVSAIQSQHFTGTQPVKADNPVKTPEQVPQAETKSYAKVPAGFQYGANIHFTGEHQHKGVVDIDPNKYLSFSENTKKRYRKKFANFNNAVNKSELFDAKDSYLPLASERDMDEFIKTSRIYLNYKENPIICLGRSPKWFLNAAQWMKDGIDPYKFVSFSKYWYRPDPREGMKPINGMEPTKDEIKAYRRYLNRIKADPQSIVEQFKKTGKKTVITDYICTGKGVTSFLSVLADYADEKGILEDFSKSIQIVGIGCMDYLESFYHDDEEISEPKVIMPEKLRKFSKNIKQEFYNMDYNMFRQMLLNQNTNECRSSYYPHEAWTLYSPDRFKTGLISMNKAKKFIEDHKESEKSFKSFNAAMSDYRNLLTFRILDGLNSRNLLSLVHKTKV